MLVLTRKVNESIVIGRDVEITITRIHGESVRVAISAPRGVEILRKEILEDVASQNKAAVAPGYADIAELLGLSKLEARRPE